MQLKLAATWWRAFLSTSIMLFSSIGVARIVEAESLSLCLLLQGNALDRGRQPMVLVVVGLLWGLLLQGPPPESQQDLSTDGTWQPLFSSPR